MNASSQKALQALSLDETPCPSTANATHNPVAVEVGKVRIERYTEKYLLGETLLDIGKIVLNLKETVQPQIKVWAIYEIPKSLEVYPHHPAVEASFTRVSYYLSGQIAHWAFRELQDNKATIQTLSIGFSGRDLMEMKAFLVKNYVHKK